jgi:peptidoglycan hydrolase-like protein with peptidoglycan-binding domain
MDLRDHLGKHTGFRFGAAVAMLMAVPACGAAVEPDSTDEFSSAPRTGESASDLTVGSKGEAVRALHHYLTTYGYFPNPELAAEYPRWQAIVPDGPRDPSVFDEQTALAVSAYQRNMALEVTGVVDAATRKMIATPRCGYPDGAAPIDPRDKWALTSGNWSPRTTVGWHLPANACPSCNAISQQQIHDAIAAAVATWNATSSLTIVESPSTSAEIQITFGYIDGPSKTLAGTTPIGANFTGGDINIDTSEIWTATLPVPPTAHDLQSTVLHELGHAIGIDHSSVQAATMWIGIGAGQSQRFLLTEDAIAASVLYDTMQSMPGAANDIAVDALGDVWIINNTPIFDGFGVQRWNGSAWISADGWATRIALESNGTPWVIGSGNAIYRRTSVYPDSGSWQAMPGCAHDIAAGGGVWALGCVSAFGGWDIWQWTGSTWVQASGVGVRIAVDQNGVPTVVTPTGAIVRLSTNSAATGVWNALPSNLGAVDSRTDIYVDSEGYTFLEPHANDDVYALMQNQASAGIPAENQWFPYYRTNNVPANYFAIAGGLLPPATGNPAHQGIWIVAGDHTIWRAVR